MSTKWTFVRVVCPLPKHAAREDAFFTSKASRLFLFKYSKIILTCKEHLHRASPY